MNITDLKIFTEIYRTQSISTAAANLFQTQSTISKRLSTLEKELNCILFQRGRGISEVKPTIPGDQLYPKAQQIISLWEDAVKACNQSEKFRLRIGAVDSIASYKLQDFFADLTKIKPDWEIELVLSDSLMICEMVRDGQLDIGITNGEAFFSELHVNEILSEDFVVYTKDPDFTDSCSINLNDLNPYFEIFHVYGSNYNAWHRSVIHPGCAKGTVNQVHMALSLMQQTKDWIILPKSVALNLISDHQYLHPLNVANLKRKGYVISSINLNPEKRKLIQEFEELLNQKLR